MRHRRISSTRVLSSDCESDTEEFLPPARDGDIEPGLYVVATPIGNLEVGISQLMPLAFPKQSCASGPTQ